MTDIPKRHNIHVYSPQKENPGQAQVMIAPKSSMVNQWAFTGVSNQSVREGLLSKAGMTQKQLHYSAVHSNTGDASQKLQLQRFPHSLQAEDTSLWSLDSLDSSCDSFLNMCQVFTLGVSWASSSLLEEMFLFGGKCQATGQHITMTTMLNSMEVLKIPSACIFIINVKCVFRNTLLILISLV